MIARFGPAGNCNAFYEAGNTATEQQPASLRQAVALLDKAQGTHLSATLEQELRQRASGGGTPDRRVNGAVERQRQATRQAVRPR